MAGRLPFRLLPLLFLAAAAAARTVHVPLDPATLGGAKIFTDAEDRVARAARTAGLEFTAEPRPLPPRVILVLDTPEGRIARRGGIVLWRGDMLPDQLAPAETGTLLRKRRQPDGTWKTTRTREGLEPATQTNLVPTARSGDAVSLPAMIIETAYHLGVAGEAHAALILWRTPEEGTAPIGGAISLLEAPPEWIDALRAAADDFPGYAEWAAEFDALSP